MQHKLLSLQNSQVKFDDSGRKFSGYASVFDGVDSYGDTIKRGAYKRTLVDRERAIKMRWNHHGPVIGKWLDIREDEKGLWVEGELTKGHSVADDVAASLAHGAVDGMSIGYYVKDYDQQGNKRELKDIELIEISVVEEPADNAARVVDVKSALLEVSRLADVERLLRDQYQASRTDATAIVAAVKKIVQGEPELKTEELSNIFNDFLTK